MHVCTMLGPRLPGMRGAVCCCVFCFSGTDCGWRRVQSSAYNTANNMIKTNVLTLARFDLSQNAAADHGAHFFEARAPLYSVCCVSCLIFFC